MGHVDIGQLTICRSAPERLGVVLLLVGARDGLVLGVG